MSEKEPQNLELPTCGDQPLWDISLGAFNLPALIVAEEVGLFPFLEKTPATPEEVAPHFSFNLRAAEALLGVLASLGFLAKYQGRFYITEVSRNFLLPESPYNWGVLLRAPPVIPDLCSAIKGILKMPENKMGERAVEVFGKLKESGKMDYEQVKIIAQKSHVRSLPAALAVAKWGDFKGVKRLLDMGGGAGSFCIGLALRYPEMEFTVADLAAICEIATQYIADYGLEDRISVQAVDMFEDEWPSGNDAVFFSNIFHDWGRERSIYLGQKSFDILPSGGRIYLHELLLPDTKDDPPALTVYSMVLMFSTTGNLFTAGELDELLTECGFEDVTIIHTFGYHSLIMGKKP